jgi:hypothetical protein
MVFLNFQSLPRFASTEVTHDIAMCVQDDLEFEVLLSQGNKSQPFGPQSALDHLPTITARHVVGQAEMTVGGNTKPAMATNCPLIVDRQRPARGSHVTQPLPATPMVPAPCRGFGAEAGINFRNDDFVEGTRDAISARSCSRRGVDYGRRYTRKLDRDLLAETVALPFCTN